MAFLTLYIGFCHIQEWRINFIEAKVDIWNFYDSKLNDFLKVFPKFKIKGVVSGHWNEKDSLSLHKPLQKRSGPLPLPILKRSEPLEWSES